MWRAYGTGPGKFMPWTTYHLPKTLPEVNKISEHSAEFIQIKTNRPWEFKAAS